MKDILGFEINDLLLIAKKNKKENELFVRHIKHKKHPNINNLAFKLNEEANAKINCLSCGNCCKTLGPRFSSRDIEILAKAENLKAEEFIKEFTRRDPDGGYAFKTLPCRYLNDDNSCFIYDEKPKSCADFPYTDIKKTDQNLSLLVKNTASCPIAYLVIEGLKLANKD